MQRKDVAFIVALVLLLELVAALLVPFFGRFLSFTPAPVGATTPVATPDASRR
ncbi:MAG: hypothetical protein ACYDCO_27295 [Armatimonadota bacterium]